jgi:hypothetical protein
MHTKFKHFPYVKLNSRQQEAYNFQKVSAVLADYGYVTIRLSSDWSGADFIAQHVNGTFLKVQLKGRLTFCKKYEDQDLHICFPDKRTWFLYPHDELLRQFLSEGKIEGTESWEFKGEYHFPRLNDQLKALLEQYRLVEAIAQS